jgi:hypothetical protein
VVALLVVSGLAPATAVAAPNGALDARPSVDGTPTKTTAVSSGNTTITIDMQPGGDARWTITIRETVSNESDAADLEALAREYENGTTEFLSTTPFSTAAQSVGDAVDRDMEITDVERNGEVTNDTLQLTVSFRWTNFARTGNNVISVRDVFNGSTGQWFGAGVNGGPGLTSNQRLVIVPPEGYSISSVSGNDYSIQDGTIRWQGPVSFDGESLYAIFTRDGSGPTPTTSITSTTVGTEQPGPDDESNALLIPLALFVIGALVAAAYIATRSDVTIGPDDVGDAGPTGHDSEDSDGGASVRAESAVEEGASADSTAAAEGASAGAAQSAADAAPDEEIDVEGFLEGWANLEDTHDFFPLLRKYGVSRTQALRLGEGRFTRRVADESVRKALQSAAEQETPIMVFVGSPGCIQIHTGPVNTLKATPPWYNVLDPGFQLHLNEALIAQSWVVEKPVESGRVTSLEVIDEEGGVIVRLFGRRKDGAAEREDWRSILKELPESA